MKLEINIEKLKPMTTNLWNRTTKKGKHYKSPEAQAYETEIDYQMVQFMRKVKAFNDYYDSKEHYLRIEYRFYLPFITRAGTIMKRKHDVDNFVKPFQDVLFKYLKPDDSEVLEFTATKIHSEDCKIVAEVYMCDLRVTI